jgi:hypothetical protein
MDSAHQLEVLTARMAMRVNWQDATDELMKALDELFASPISEGPPFDRVRAARMAMTHKVSYKVRGK